MSAEDQQRLFAYEHVMEEQSKTIVALEATIRLLEEQVKLLRDENDRMRACLKYLDKQGGLGLTVHDRITKALTRYS